MTPLPEDPCALYRFWNADGVLLYVGITGHLPSRTGQHDKSQPWWKDVVSMTVEHFETRSQARAAEQRAMDEEKPLHNIARSVGKTPLHSFRIPDDTYKVAQSLARERGETLSDVVRRAFESYIKD